MSDPNNSLSYRSQFLTSYYQCIGGKKFVQRCADGLFWVRAKNGCDWPENSDCEDKSYKKGDSCDDSINHKRDPDNCAAFTL